MAINNNNISTLRIQFPNSIHNQIKIVEKIEDFFSLIDNSIKSLQKAMYCLLKYRQAILKSAVEGNLSKSWREEHSHELEHASFDQERMLEEHKNKWKLEQLEIYKNKGKMPKDNKWKKKYKKPFDINPSNKLKLPNGWTWATIDQISESVRYGTSAKCSSDPVGVPILAMGNIINGELSFENLKYLPRQHGEFHNLLLKKGDILFNRTNSPELVGKTAMFKDYKGEYSFASYLIQVRVGKRMKPEFIVYFINSFYGKQWIKSVVTQQTGQANVNGTKLKQLTIPFPSFKEQENIVEIVEKHLSKVREQEILILNTLKLSELLKQSILKKAVEGKLVPEKKANSYDLFLLRNKQDESEKNKANKHKNTKQTSLDKWKF